MVSACALVSLISALSHSRRWLSQSLELASQRLLLCPPRRIRFAHLQRRRVAQLAGVPAHCWRRLCVTFVLGGPTGHSNVASASFYGQLKPRLRITAGCAASGISTTVVQYCMLKCPCCVRRQHCGASLSFGHQTNCHIDTVGTRSLFLSVLGQPVQHVHSAAYV